MQLANVLGVALGAGVGGEAVALVETHVLAPAVGFTAAFAAMIVVALATTALAPRASRRPAALH